MNDKSFVVTSDFDGTLFDPNFRIILAWAYNHKTSRLLTTHDIPLVLNTGRPIWDYFSDFQIMIAGMKKPDVVIYGAGTNIAWLTETGYVEDEEWQKRMKAAKWDKKVILNNIQPFLTKYNAKLFDSENPYMTRIWVYKTDIKRVFELIKELERKFPKTHVLPTEQILLPNTDKIFSGYFLLIPAHTDKEVAMQYVLGKLQKNSAKKLTNLVFGDAWVDTVMLKDPASHGYALNPTPMCRQELLGSTVEICSGGAPENLLRILKSHLSPPKSSRNSPFRGFSNILTHLLERYIEPKKTPDELSLKGLALAKKALARPHILSGFTLLWGMLLDVLDGARARKKPHQSTPDGQLIDVYADRTREFLLLSSKGNFDAAISCFLPSIARAQAEAMGVIVPEYDTSGGSALSRSVKLLRSFTLYSLGLNKQAQNIENSIFSANLQTFQNRTRYIQNFSWDKLSSYDKPSVKRLLFLIFLLQNQLKTQKKVDNKVLKELLDDYLKIDIEKFKKTLQISFPKL